METQNWINIGSGNGLLPDGTKPLPEPMLTYQEWSPVAFTWEPFHKFTYNARAAGLYNGLYNENYTALYCHISQDPMS